MAGVITRVRKTIMKKDKKDKKKDDIIVYPPSNPIHEAGIKFEECTRSIDCNSRFFLVMASEFDL